ncbi:MAG TPA: glycerol dehydrogenase, partial [Candidatus Melainabacteria bacterium]|nr:glycerol dehydrogenase [Candidatus Melainabacteria bacterium]
MKKLSVFCSPARYVQGEGATASLGAEISRLSLGERAFIVAGSSALKHLALCWETTFGEASLDYE